MAEGMWGKDAASYVKTLRSRADLARFLAEAKDVGSTDTVKGDRYSSGPSVAVYFYRGRLVRVGEVAQCRFEVHEVAASDVSWLQRKAVAPIAEAFGAPVSVKRSRVVCADWEMGGTMQGTLMAPRAPRGRVVIG